MGKKGNLNINKERKEWPGGKSKPQVTVAQGGRKDKRMTGRSKNHDQETNLRSGALMPLS